MRRSVRSTGTRSIRSVARSRWATRLPPPARGRSRRRCASCVVVVALWRCARRAPPAAWVPPWSSRWRDMASSSDSGRPRDMASSSDSGRPSDMTSSDPFTVERRAEIAVVTFDVPGASVNTLRPGFDRQFDTLLDELQRDPQIRAAVLISGKRDSFIAGADVDRFRDVTSVEDGTRLAQVGQRVAHRMAASEKPLVFRQAEANVRARTGDTMPAPLRAIEVIRTGVERGADAGFAAEAHAFGELLLTPQARNLIRVFQMRQALRREARQAAVAATDVSKVAVVGAGLMGAGIAAVTVSRAGIPVRLKDVERDALRHGMRSIRDYLEQRVQRRKITAHERDRLLSLVHPGTDYRGFGRVDLVIEAVVEDLAVKHQVVKEVTQVTGPDTIVASNTSAIPIDRIAEGHPRPELVVGMHYFSPVPRVPLLEVVEGPRTAAWVTATAVDVGQRQGMTVVVVGDGPGFYTSRILGPYINEAAHLLSDGASIHAIDQAMERLGFPVGPFRLIDEVGIDVAAKISRILRGGLGDRLAPSATMPGLVPDGRQGRKNGRGFLRYH